jgi:hypothetical protein
MGGWQPDNGCFAQYTFATQSLRSLPNLCGTQSRKRHPKRISIRRGNLACGCMDVPAWHSPPGSSRLFFHQRSLR